MSCILKAPYPDIHQVLILPNPKLGDTMALRHTVNFHTTMTNSTRTYVRTRDGRTLTYSFGVTNKKMWEVRRFLIDNCGNKILLQNHDLELWLGYIVTEQPEFTATHRYASMPAPKCPAVSQDMFEFELQFKGQLIGFATEEE